MQSKHRSPVRIFLLGAAIILVLLFLSQLWAPAPDVEGRAGGEAVNQDAPTLGEQHPVLAAENFNFSIDDICAANGDDSGSASSTQSYEESSKQIEQSRNRLQKIKDRLVVSPTAEHLHLAALLERDPVVRTELIKNAVSQNPNVAYLLRDAVHICADDLDKIECPIQAWEDRLLAIDRQNSESWVAVAESRFQRGEHEDAFTAMRQAAAAAETQDYWTESIEMIERGLSATTDYPFSKRAGMAFGIAAMAQHDPGPFIRMCENQSLKSADWAYVCLGYGELVEKQGKNYMRQSVALSVQKLALEAIGDEEQLAAVLKRREALKQEMRELAPASDSVTLKLMVSNPGNFSAYLAAVRTHGEAGAMDYLREETNRWLSQHEDLDCTR